MYNLKFKLLQLELINVLNRLNIEPNCNRLNARKQALVYRLWAEKFLTANQNITDWHKIDSDMKKFNEEYPELVLESEIIEHPYKGLVDNKGSLTRYLVIIDNSCTLKWSKKEIEEYLSEEGNFDSCECYGANPYDRSKLDSGIPAKLLGRFATQTRLDFLPKYKGEFPLHNTVTAMDYIRLSKGAEFKAYLKVYGVKTNKSLFHLNNKGKKWVDREVATKASYKAIIRLLHSKEVFHWIDLLHNPYKKDGNKAFLYAVKCITKNNRMRVGRCYPNRNIVKTEKLREYLLTKGKESIKIVGVTYYL